MKRKFTIPVALAVFAAIAAILLARQPAPRQTENVLTVFAASSLAWVLRKNEDFIEQTTGADLVIVEAASSTLARQITQGAPADIFITADRVWLDYLTERGLFEGAPFEVARNRLVFALSPQAADYCGVVFFAPPNADHLLGVCPFQGKVATGDFTYVPLGMYAREAIDHFGWDLRLVLSQDARAALTLVENGAASAGLLYRTDGLAANSGLVLYDVPEDSHSPILYWGAALKQSNPDATKKFFDFLNSEDFKTILQDTGFEVN